MISRAHRSPVNEWWWTVDRTMLSLVLLLLFGGLVLSLAASPAVAERIDLSTYHFVLRHAVFMPVAALVLVGISFLTPRQVRRVAAVTLLVCLILMVAVLFVGPEVKGSRRWLYIAGLSVQPSEFMKPAFIVITAWLLAEGSRRPPLAGQLLATVLLAIVVALLMAEPDLGQTLLVCAVWGALYFLAGMPVVLIGVLGALGVAGVVFAYYELPHVRARIDGFLDPSSGDAYQVTKALESFQAGGWVGVGPGEGLVKRVLPDSHTDFVFAVVAEEFGILLCLVLVALFAVLVLRGLLQAMRRRDPFERLAIAGLSMQIGVQAFVNMGVNLRLLPAKGMTLPFISYGGSALLSAALAMGFLLALSRRRSEQRLTAAPYALAPGHG